MNVGSILPNKSSNIRSITCIYSIVDANDTSMCQERCDPNPLLGHHHQAIKHQGGGEILGANDATHVSSPRFNCQCQCMHVTLLPTPIPLLVILARLHHL